MDLGWAANIASQIVVDVASGVILSKLPLHRKKRKKQKEEREVKIERYNLYRARRKTKKEKLGD
jgi:hypothetical protein